MKFAASVEPENKDVTDKLQWSIEMKKDGNKDTVSILLGISDINLSILLHLMILCFLSVFI